MPPRHPHAATPALR